MTDQLTATGLEIDDFETRLDALLTTVRGDISPIIDGSADSSEGQFLRIFCEREQALAELIQAVHAAQYPEGATGVSLTALSRLTGTERDVATKSFVECRVNVDAGVYGIGTLIAHVSGDPTARFVNAVSVTNAGPGAANVDDVLFEAETAGPVAAPSGTLTVIAEPVIGWNSITNAPPGGSGDATIGEDDEQDTPLRLRRSSELQSGSSAVNAIYSALSRTDGVLWAAVLENDDDDPDVYGIPGHAIWCIVRAPTLTDAEIADVIAVAKAGGNEAYGATVVPWEDSQGNYHGIGFTRVALVDGYVRVDLTKDPEDYAGDAAVKTAIVAYGTAHLGPGVDLIPSKMTEAALSVGGVKDVTLSYVGLAAPPASATKIGIAWSQMAVLDTTRVTVNSTNYLDG